MFVCIQSYSEKSLVRQVLVQQSGCLRLFNKNFEFMLNFKVFEGQVVISCCINPVNSGTARAVPKTIVYEIVVTLVVSPETKGLQMWGQSAVALTELGGGQTSLYHLSKEFTIEMT